MSSPFERLAEAVAPQVLLDAVETSSRLTALGVPHALIDGLAVGVHGHPRATKDADFLVGPEAFATMTPLLVYRDELAEIVRVGVVDLLAVPEEFPQLADVLQQPEAGQIPVVPVEALVLMKLHAYRPQDRADVQVLLAVGADPARIVAYLRTVAPHLEARFAEVAAR